MTPEEKRIEHALRSGDPGPALRLSVQELARAGHSKAAIYHVLESFLIRLHEGEGYRESDEDTLLDVMDSLTGWCHPEAELLPDGKPIADLPQRES